MNHKRVIVATAVLGLVLILAWGCQNSKPVGPMKYVSLKASVSTKGIAKPSAGEYAEVLYRVTGPSMNPVSGKVTMGIPEQYVDVGIKSTAVSPSAAEIVNFTMDVPAGPSRTLAVQINLVGIPLYSVGPGMADPNQVVAIGATQFDIDPGTQVVNVPVEIGPICREGGVGECYSVQGYVAYMGKTDLVNCAYVPDAEAFRDDSCDAKRYFYGIEKKETIVTAKEINVGPEIGDVYCIWWDENCHTWAQVAGVEGDMYWIYSQNCKFPYYGFDPQYACFYQQIER